MKTIIILIGLFLGIHSTNAQWYSVNSNTTSDLTSITFYDSLIGYCFGQGAFLKTNDGGDNWSTDSSFSFPSTVSIEIAYFINENELMIGGHNFSSNFLFKLDFNSNTIDSIFMNSHNLSSQTQLTKTTTFTIVSIGHNILSLNSNGEILDSVSFSDPVVALSSDIQNNKVYALTEQSDNSRSLFELNLMTFNSTPISSNLASFSGWNPVVEKLGTTFISAGWYPGSLRTSADGVQWADMANTFQGYNIRKGYYAFNEHFLIGSSGLILKYNDTSILSIDSLNTNSALNSIYFQTANIGFVCGSGGAIYKTTNAHLGTNEIIDFNNSITIFPNPAKNSLYIVYQNIANILSVELYDNNGRLLKNIDVNNHSIDVSNLSTGCYMLTFTTNQGRITKKVVIE